MKAKRKRRFGKKQRSTQSNERASDVHATESEPERRAQPPIKVRSRRRGKRLRLISKWAGGIVAASSLAYVLLAFWQYYNDVPQIVSEVRGIEAIEKVERLAGGRISSPKSVVIGLEVFLANTGRRATGVDKITIEAPLGIGYNPQNSYDNFRLEVGDSKKINLSIEIPYDLLSNSQPVNIDMTLIGGKQVSVDKGVITEGITMVRTEPTESYKPTVVYTDLWCNDERMKKAREMVGAERYEHGFPVDVTENGKPASKNFVSYYYCSSVPNRPQIKSYPIYYAPTDKR
jgi:hypothetical protein